MPPKFKTMQQQTAEAMKALSDQLKQVAETMTERIEQARLKVESHPRRRRTNPKLEPVR
jgi:hypothetical protein